MNPFTHGEPRKLAPNQRAAPRLAKQRSSLALLAIFATLLITTLFISGCAGLTNAGTPGKTNSNGTTPGVLAASASTFNFGNVATGSKSMQPVTLTNNGTTAIMISQATVSGPGFSVVGGTSSVSIATGKIQVFQIEFAPQVAGSSNGSLVVSSDASDSSLTFSLSGIGIAGPSI